MQSRSPHPNWPTVIDKKSHEARSDFIDAVGALNSKIRKTMRRELTERQTDFLAAPFPTLDLNLWTSYPGLASGIVRVITQDVKPEFRSRLDSLILLIKRSPLLMLLEATSFFLRPQLGIRYQCPTGSYRTRFAIFTYSDFEFEKITPQGKSRFWGSLPAWLDGEAEFQWVGIGSTGNASASRLVKATERVRGNSRVLRSYVKTFRARVKVWKNVRQTLSEVHPFQSLTAEFRRALFGLPALEALHLSRVFRNFLAEEALEFILTPHENQLWERILAYESAEKDVKVVGALHTSPRFWDLRFLEFGEFSSLQPDLVIDNGPLSREILLLGGRKEEEILSGTGLRFSHLGPKQRKRTLPGEATAQTRALVITGMDKRSAKRLVELSLSLRCLDEFELTFRPHPANSPWFQKKFPECEVDAAGIEHLAGSYGLFITESVSSLALELLALGQEVCIYAPQDGLNFSPLLSAPQFDRFFWDEDSLARLIGKAAPEVDFETIISVTNERRVWLGNISRLRKEASRK